MNEDFVTYKLARKLKGNGFREKTFAYYTSSGTLQWRRAYIYDTPITDIMKCSNKDNTVIDAPTISQVLKWFREEKKIHIGFGYSPRKKWRYVVMYMDDRFYNKPTLAVDGFLEIEETALAGITYCLDNLI